MSSPLTTKSSRADRYDWDFQRSEIQIQTPESRDCTKLPVHGRSVFHVRTPEARTAPHFLFMLKLPRLSLPYHHSAHRQVHSCQMYLPWRRLYETQQMSKFHLTRLCRTEPVAPDLLCADLVGAASRRKVLRLCGWRPFIPSQSAERLCQV
jgi:hypothetical protein